LTVHLDGINVSIGETGYRTTHYAYWGKNGALVVDFAVGLELPAPGETPTWWQVQYGEKPDPAFILPWRYDPEKDIAIEDEAKRQQTKEISFHPNSPAPGDIITVRTRIHNYSLLPTTGVVDVRFYVGDPNDGGTPIVGNLGETKLTTEDAIPERGKTTIEMKWRVPNDISQFPRIYAVIDPENKIDEIHENNNIGWAVLGQQELTTGVEDLIDYSLPTDFRLEQNYPNPFNPRTNIIYYIATPEKVTLKIYDILGREVKVLVEGVNTAGTHAVSFDASQLASGVYFYRLTLGTLSRTKKMLLLQ